MRQGVFREKEKRQTEINAKKSAKPKREDTTEDDPKPDAPASKKRKGKTDASGSRKRKHIADKQSIEEDQQGPSDAADDASKSSVEAPKSRKKAAASTSKGQKSGKGKQPKIGAPEEGQAEGPEEEPQLLPNTKKRTRASSKAAAEGQKAPDSQADTTEQPDGRGAREKAEPEKGVVCKKPLKEEGTKSTARTLCSKKGTSKPIVHGAAYAKPTARRRGKRKR